MRRFASSHKTCFSLSTLYVNIYICIYIQRYIHRRDLIYSVKKPHHAIAVLQVYFSAVVDPNSAFFFHLVFGSIPCQCRYAFANLCVTVSCFISYSRRYGAEGRTHASMQEVSKVWPR